MNRTHEDVIESIEAIDSITMESESEALTKLINTYSKAYTILENYEGDAIDSFTVFSEGYYMEANNDEPKPEEEKGTFFRRIDEKTGKKESILKSIIWSIPRIFKLLWDKIVGIFKKATGKLTNRADAAVKKIQGHDKEVVEVADAVTAEVMDDALEKSESKTEKPKKKKDKNYAIKTMNDEPPELTKLKFNLGRFMTNLFSKSTSQKEIMSFKTFEAKNKTFMDFHRKVEKVGWAVAAGSMLGFMGTKSMRGSSITIKGKTKRIPNFLTPMFVGLTAISALTSIVNRGRIIVKYLLYRHGINQKRRSTLVCIKQLEREIDFCKKIETGADSVINRCDAIFAAKGKSSKVSTGEVTALIDYIFDSFIDDKEVTITEDDYVDIIKDENLEKVKTLVEKYCAISKTVPDSFSRLQKAIDKTCAIAAKKITVDDETTERIKNSKRVKGQEYSIEEKIVFLNQFGMILSGMIEHMNSNVTILVELLEAIGYACDEIKKIESTPSNTPKKYKDEDKSSSKDKNEESSDEEDDEEDSNKKKRSKDDNEDEE